MKQLAMFSLALATVVATFGVLQADDKQEKKTQLQCPVMDKPAKESVSTEYKGAKIYFCCPGCIKAFEANKAKHAAKANEQLVASGQAKQKACPLSGKPAGDEKAEIDGVVVRFCCAGCKAAVEKAEAEKRREMIFGEKAFEKGFEVKKQEKKEDNKA